MMIASGEADDKALLHRLVIAVASPIARLQHALCEARMMVFRDLLFPPDR